MVRRLSRCVVAVLLLVGPVAARPVSGLVYRDANGNGRHDAGEAGLAGVSVTDGLSFALTGADGRYALDAQVDPLRGDRAAPIVTVCWPTGVWPSTSRWRAVTPESDATAADFGLRPQEQRLPFRFVHATDCHVPRAGKAKFADFRAEVARIAREQAFCVLTGDNVDLSNAHPLEQGLAEWAYLTECLRDFPVPWLAVTGNHDVAGVQAKVGWDKADPRYGYGLYDQLIGPLRWSFDYAGVHFVGVDFNTLLKGKWQWGVPTAGIDWLERDLARVPAGTRRYLFVHYPQSPDPRFGKVLTEGKLTGIICGHAHTDRAFKYQGIPALIGGSVAQVFEDKDRLPGYRLIEVTADGYDSFYKATGQAHAIAIDAPRFNQALAPGQPIRGGFYDPERQVTKLTVSFGEVKAEVPFERGRLACRFTAQLDLSGLADGTYPMVVTVSDGQQELGVWKYAYKLAKPKG